MSDIPTLYGPNDELHQVISKSITTLLRDYIDFPTRLMREIGHQAYLSQLLNDELKKGITEAELCQGASFKPLVRGHSGLHQVQRVQMEIKVDGLQRSDVVVLRDGGTIQITRYGQGVNDVVAKVQAKDVDAIIELKACCSADISMRHGCRLDVVKLARIECVRPIRKYFVFIDKSLASSKLPALNGRKERIAREDWHGESWPQCTTRQRELYGPLVIPTLSVATADTSAVCVWDVIGNQVAAGGADIRGPRWMEIGNTACGQASAKRPVEHAAPVA